MEQEGASNVSFVLALFAHVSLISYTQNKDRAGIGYPSMLQMIEVGQFCGDFSFVIDILSSGARWLAGENDSEKTLTDGQNLGGPQK